MQVSEELATGNGRWFIEVTHDDLIDLQGRQFRRYHYANADEVFLGFAPMPMTVWETFTYHLYHGLLMRYPLWDVLTFAWHNRRSFVDSVVADALEGD